MSLTLELLTDQDILELSQNRVITDHRDINMKYTSKIEPYPKGVYDPVIFGSLYPNKCKCGYIRKQGITCPKCGVTVLSNTDKYNRFARVDSPVYFLHSIREKEFIKWFFNAFQDYELRMEVEGVFNKRILDLCSFTYESESETIVVKLTNEDIKTVSYEGILRLLEELNPGEIGNFMKLVSKSILITNPISRMFSFDYSLGYPRLVIPEVTASYQSCIKSINYISNLLSTYEDPNEKAYLLGILRNFLSLTLGDISGILKTSKQNDARKLYSKRINNSGRAVITPDPTLPIDTVSLPFHLAYEVFKEEFVKYLMDRDELSFRHAVRIHEEMDKATLSDFKEMVTNQMVILNRNPTLHEYSMMGLKVQLNYSYTIGLPLLLCKPFNGDFDGDEMSFYAVPPSFKELVYSNMSPRNQLRYKKNLSPIFVPSHELLTGLNLATKIRINDKKVFVNSIDDIPEDFDERDLVLTEKGPSSKYIMELEKILDMDLNKILSKPDSEVLEPINSTNILTIISLLDTDPLRVEKLQKMQEFALEVVTIEGVTTINLDEIHKLIPKESLDHIKEVYHSNMDQRLKLEKMESLYKEYLDNLEQSLPDIIVEQVKASDRIKISSLLAILSPQLYISTEDEVVLTDSSLIQGMNYEEYVHHAVNNRLMQDIKVSSVPSGGYFQRQVINAAQKWKVSDDPEVVDKVGLLIPRNLAEGRLDMDNNRLGKSTSTELIKVQSVVNTPVPYRISTSMINPLLNYSVGDNIGVSLISSCTEGFTQKGLSLKHGGILYYIDRDLVLKSPINGKLVVEDNFISIVGSNEVLKYPIPSSAVVSENSEVKEGDLVYLVFKKRNPSYKLDCLIKFLKARPTAKLRAHEKSEYIVSDCYAFNSGKIKYEVDDEGNIGALINGVYHYLGNEVPIHPEGSSINKFDRLSSGIVNLTNVFNNLKDTDSRFNIFLNQILEISGTSLIPEAIELLYRIIINEQSQEFLGVNKSIKDNNSIFAQIAYGGAKKVVNSLAKLEPTEFGDDLFAESVLGLVLNERQVIN